MWGGGWALEEKVEEESGLLLFTKKAIKYFALNCIRVIISMIRYI
jgi:hypothetical protein